MKHISLGLVLLLWCCSGENAEKYYNNGFLKGETGNYKEAIIDYNKAIEINSNHSKAYYNRGDAKYNLGDYIGAIAGFNKALEINGL